MSSGYILAQIINMLREMEVGLSPVKTVGQVYCSLGFSEQSYYRWRLGYGGLRVNQAERLKEREKANKHPRLAVSDLTLGKQILKETLEGLKVHPKHSSGADCGSMMDHTSGSALLDQSCLELRLRPGPNR